MSTIDVSVAIDDAHLQEFGAVVKRSKRAGLKVKQAMQEIGVVTGSIDAGKLSALRKVKGIASIEAERQIQLPSPESDTQ